MAVTLRDHGIDISNKANSYDRDAIKGLLNATGCGFCLAKFTQITLHLGIGQIHSCHHPTPHKIPLKELEQNPMTLLNTPKLKSARKQMLNDEKPDECDYCWRIESNDGDSDRFFKSQESWALRDHDKIVQLSGDEDLYPSYLEVSFGNACNMSCLYCGPEFSSKWTDELRDKGPVVLFSELEDDKVWAQGWQDLNNLHYRNRDNNPYIDAFWKIFPDIYKHLKHYRITGGEPLMSKETFRSMDWFIDNPNTDLELSINSNLSVPDKLWNEFTERLQVLRLDKVKKVTIYTSVEGWGDRAAYARHGLEFDLLKQRVEQLAAMGNVRVVIMSTFNIFSISSFQQLLEWVLMLKKKYNPNNSSASVERATGQVFAEPSYQERNDRNPSHSFVVGIDIPYLRHPEYLDAQYCTQDLVEQYLLPCIKFMSDNVAWPLWSDHQGFEPYEVEKLKRIVMHRIYFNKLLEPKREADLNIIKNRASFYDFVNEMDKRRGTNFAETFPEYQGYIETCKAARQKWVESHK